MPGLYDLAGRVVRVTPLRKISAGLFLLAASFLLLAADARSPQLPARLAQLPLELARPRRLGPQ